MTRDERARYESIWSNSWDRLRSAAFRDALLGAMRAFERPTLGDLLALVHEGACDLECSELAADTTISELLGRPASGPTIAELLERFDLGWSDPRHDAKCLGLDVEVYLDELLVGPVD